MLRTTPTTNHSPLATRGLTLVEMLISMAVTLVMMAAVVNLFANIGAGVKTRNASMQLGTQLRLARARLFKDLAGATSAARPKLPSDDHDDGYLEIIEGQWSDKNPSLLTDGTDNGATSTNPELDYTVSIVPSSNLTLAAGDITDGGGLGDYDDILALTVRSESDPFVGRMPIWDTTVNDGQGNAGWWRIETIESNLAEVIWYTVENSADGSLGEPGMRTIYRRVLLIAPWVVDLPNYSGAAPAKRNAINDSEFFRLCDVSFRREGTLRVANTLSDLTKRENRFAHRILLPSIFPHAIQMQNIRFAPFTDASPLHPFGINFETLKAAETDSSDRQGEDVMLSDVLAFDLRVFDPGAPLFDYLGLGVVVEPSSDSVFTAAAAPPYVPIGYGAFVDLGWDESYSYNADPIAPQPDFQEERRVGYHPRNPGLGPFRGTPAVYDTWPYHYESDGINQDSASDNGAGVDQGTNGLDDIVLYDHDGNPATPSILPASGVNGVDDASERETAPPYDTPLRGMQVKIRVYDRDSRQIREATVTRNFVPQ